MDVPCLLLCVADCSSIQGGSPITVTTPVVPVDNQFRKAIQLSTVKSVSTGPTVAVLSSPATNTAIFSCQKVAGAVLHVNMRLCHLQTVHLTLILTSYQTAFPIPAPKYQLTSPIISNL